jgi:hypothetical protein
MPKHRNFDGPTDFNAIWAEAKANTARLNSCPGPHEFTPVEGAVKMMGGKWACAHCHGIVDQIAHQWYQIGRQHGTRSFTESHI